MVVGAGVFDGLSPEAQALCNSCGKQRAVEDAGPYNTTPQIGV